MTVLVVGGTGTLGRQIVRRALDKGYKVRCLVRNIRKATFLREWGAELVYADLKRPETLPTTFIGVSIVIDAATFRTDDEACTLKEIDLIGKLSLIRAAQASQVKRYIFFSLPYSLDVPFLKFKKIVEKQLIQSNIPYTIFCVSGFYQGLISQYAIPILENQSIWLTTETTTFNYLNSQDVACFCIASLDNLNTNNSVINLTGKRPWKSIEIVQLCEKLSGQKASVRTIPLFFLTTLRLGFGFSQWGWPISDRLAFSTLLDSTSTQKIDLKFDELCAQFSLEPSEILSLEDYLREYFEIMLQKLRDLNYDQSQAMKRKDLTF